MPLIKIDQICPLCLSGRKKNVKLKVFQMNFTQGALVCPSKNCPYPCVENGVDKFVKLDGPPEIDISAVLQTEDSWSSVLEQMKKIISPVQDNAIKQADQVTNDLVEEFSSYASEFIDSFVKECEIEVSKSNENSIETLSHDLENRGINSSMLELDLNLNLQSISTTSGYSVSSLDCFEDSGRQTEPAEIEESYSRSFTNVIFEGDVSVLDIDSEGTKENFIDIIKKANIISDMPNDLISNLNNQQNNYQVENVHCVWKNSLNPSYVSSNKVDSYDSGTTGSNEALKYKTNKLTCTTGNTLSKKKKVNKSGQTRHASNVIKQDGLSTKLSPVANCELNSQLSSCVPLESVCKLKETQITTGVSSFLENLPNLDTPDEIKHCESIVMFDALRDSSSVVQTDELNGTDDAIKLDIQCNTKGLSKQYKNKCDLSTSCLPTINTNTDELTAYIVSGEKDTRVQNCDDQSSTEIEDLKFLNLNELMGDEVNNSSKNPPNLAETHTKRNTRIEESQTSSECKSLSYSLPLSEHSKENASKNVTSSPILNKASSKTNNKTKGSILQKIKGKFPKVSVKSQICTRSASKKQAMAMKLMELNNQNKSEISEMALENSNNNIDYQNTDKSEITFDLPLKHISDTVLCSGSSFTVEQSNFSLILDDLELSPEKNEICSSYDRYSMLNKNKLLDFVECVKKNNSSAGIKDDFVVKKHNFRSGIDRSRRLSTRNIKNEEFETCNKIPTIFNIDDDSIDKPVEEITGNKNLKNSVKQTDTKYVHSDYTYNKNSYKGAKAVKQKKSVSIDLFLNKF